MNIIDSVTAMARTLAGPLNPDLRSLLITRQAQLQDAPDAARFLIVGQGDSLAIVEAAIGMPLVLIDGLDEAPSWEWVERHGSIIEAAFVWGDSADVLLVPDCDGTDAALIALLLLYAPETHEGLNTAAA